MTHIPSRFLPFMMAMMKPQKWAFAVLIGSHLAWGVSEALFPFFIKLFIDGVVANQNNLLHLWDALAPALYTFVVLWIAIDTCFRIHDFVSAKAYPKFANHIRKTIFDYTMLHSHHYFSENFSGTIASKISRLPEAALTFLTLCYTVILPIVVAFIIEAYLLYRANPFFGLAIIVWMSIHSLITVLTTVRINQYSHDYSESLTTLNGKIVDVLSNMINVRLFARNVFEKRLLRNAQGEVRGHYQNMLLYSAWVKLLLGILSLTYIFTLVMGGIYAVSHRFISAGDFVLILSSLGLVGLLWYVSMNLVTLFQEIGTCQQALSLISQPHHVKDNVAAKPLVITKGEIAFNDVTFYYTKNRNLFSNKDIVIHGGEKVGLVGYSGSGKTTFINLILRYYDIMSGTIFIDGQNIQNVTQDSLRDQIAVIPQDTTLFHRTLRENIRYGRIDATDEDVVAAARAAHCEEFIQQTPDGYDALVGERGVKLSGGQRQRIAIARAFLKNAPILILDEATAALDSITEKHIQRSLHELMSHRTTIVIAHRLSTLYAMDRILVFDRGKIIAEGSHSELLSTCQHYRTLWETQSGGLLPDAPND